MMFGQFLHRFNGWSGKKSHANDHGVVQFNHRITPLAAVNPIHGKKLRATFHYFPRLHVWVASSFAE
jgi:hypothetical protein